MLSVLILSHKGEGYEIASKLAEEGHLVKMYCPEIGQWDPTSKVQIIFRPEEHLETADLVIDATSRDGGRCEELRERGKVVMGGRVQELLTYDQDYAHEVVRSLLELHIVDESKEGTCFQFGGWFNGKSWQETYAAQVSHRLLDQDRGPVAGNMGFVVWRESGSILQALETLLAKGKFTGFLTAEVILSQEGARFVRFYTGLDNPVLLAILESHKGEVGSLLYKSATGKEIKLSKDVDAKYACVKLMALSEEARLQLNQQASKHFWPSFDTSTLGYVTATGSDAREARRRVYRTISNITNLDVVYRSDIGAKGDLVCK